MNTANMNRAVSGFGMALAAMGATQADAEIVSLSFGGSPGVISCNGNCDVGTVLTASWAGGGLGKFSFFLSVNVSIVSVSTYNTLFVAGATGVSALAFKNKGDVVSGGAALESSVIADPGNLIGDRYLAFSTTEDLNGWIKVNFAGSSTSDFTITFVEGEIETAATAITVGGTGGLTPVPVPPMLPAMGLAVLALGAAGVRRSRKAA